MSSESSYQTHPDLEERFLQPNGWSWHMYAGHNGEKLRFGTAFPKHTVPIAVAVILPGLSEYCEKYFEMANTLLDRKYAVYIIEWQGQGRSFRHSEKFPQKRVSNGFYRDVKDLDIFIKDYILPSAVHPEVGRLPLVMLAHSMGANIGLRYLKQHPDVFSCAAMTAAMFGIYALRIIPSFMRTSITKLFSEFGDLSYAPGATDYKPRKEIKKLKGLFSSDPIRNEIHDKWMMFDPNLQVGGVTYRWLHFAAKTCSIVRKKKFLKKVKTPILLAIAGNERFVNNRTIRRIGHTLENASILELDKAAHEILMENDSIRETFLKSFDELVKTNILDKKDSVKPF